MQRELIRRTPTSSPEILATREWLERCGCSLEPIAHSTQGTLPVRILPAGELPAGVFRVTPLVTGCCPWVELATEKPGGVRIARLELDLAFGDFPFDWLSLWSSSPAVYQ